MGNVRDEIRFHSLAFHFLIHRLLKSVTHPGKFHLHRLIYSQILGDLRVQISVRHPAYTAQQRLIVSADPVIIFFDKTEHKDGVHDQRADAEKPHHRAERQHRKVDQHDFPDRLCGFF